MCVYVQLYTLASLVSRDPMCNGSLYSLRSCNWPGSAESPNYTNIGFPWEVRNKLFVINFVYYKIQWLTTELNSAHFHLIPSVISWITQEIRIKRRLKWSPFRYFLNTNRLLNLKVCLYSRRSTNGRHVVNYVSAMKLETESQNGGRHVITKLTLYFLHWVRVSLNHRVLFDFGPDSNSTKGPPQSVSLYTYNHKHWTLKNNSSRLVRYTW